MKKILLMIILFVMFCKLPCKAQENIIINNYNEMELNKMFEVAEKSFPGFDGYNIVENLTKGKNANAESIFQTIKEYAFKSFFDMAKVFALLVIAGYVISISDTLCQAFGGGASKTSFLVGYCIFAGIIVSVFAELISPARDAIDNLIIMIKSTIPALLTLLTLSGGVTTSGLMSPILTSLINIIAVILGDFLVSVIIATVSLSVADRMSDKINISSAVKFLKQFVKWVLLFCMAVYSGIYGVYGLAGSALDSRLGKATRFALGSSIPVVGGVVSDSIETIIGTIASLRSITGVVGIIAICAIAVLPLVKIAMIMWMLKLSAVILEPVSNIKIVQLTTDVADCASMIFAILTAISLLLIGCIGIILISGNFIS